MADGVVFDRQTADRLLRMLNYFERMPRNDPTKWGKGRRGDGEGSSSTATTFAFGFCKHKEDAGFGSGGMTAALYGTGDEVGTDSGTGTGTPGDLPFIWCNTFCRGECYLATIDTISSGGSVVTVIVNVLLDAEENPVYFETWNFQRDADIQVGEFVRLSTAGPLPPANNQQIVFAEHVLPTDHLWNLSGNTGAGIQSLGIPFNPEGAWSINWRGVICDTGT